jgi:hypothetical protein
MVASVGGAALLMIAGFVIAAGFGLLIIVVTKAVS